MGETVKEEQSLRTQGNTRGAAAAGSPQTSASLLGMASPYPVVLLRGVPTGNVAFPASWKVHSCAGGRLHSPALFPQPSEEAQKDLPCDAAHRLLGAGHSPQCHFCLLFSGAKPSLLLLVALVPALLLGLHYLMKIKAFVLKSFFTFEYYNFHWGMFST